MFGVGTGEIMLILVIAILVVGPERMVDFARTAGTMLAKFRLETDSITSEFREAIDLQPIKEAVDMTKEAATEVKESLETTQQIAKGEMESAQAVVKDAADSIPTTTIAPSASVFADSQVTRAASPAKVASAPAPQEATTLATVEPADSSAGEGEDVYEVTELDGPEFIDDVEVGATNNPALSEG